MWRWSPIARYMLHGFLLDEETAWDLFVEYNEKAVGPPLEEAELRSLFSSALHSIADGSIGGAPGDKLRVGEFQAFQATGKLRYRLTDTGNGRRFRDENRLKFRYHAHKAKWLCWTGTHWEEDHLERSMLAAKDVAQKLNVIADSIVVRSSSETDSEETKDRLLTELTLKKSIGSWSKTSESMPRLRAMLQAAISEPGMAAVVDEFDTNPYLINLANGTYDVESRSLLRHDPSHMITKVIPVAWNPGARCPMWETFMNQIQPDPEVVGFLQKAIGYSLIGVPKEEVMFILTGNGGNGKTTMLETIKRVMGPYSSTCNIATLMTSETRTEAQSNDLAMLKGVRLVSCSENKKGGELDEPKVKIMTGGDEICCRFLYAEFFTYYPEFAIWLSTNNRPRIKGTDDGIWRRIRLVEFKEQFIGRHENPNLKRDLLMEKEGILAWMLEGLRLYLEEGLEPPISVLQATEQYRDEEDILGNFISERCQLGANHSVTSSDLYEIYLTWVSEMNKEALGKQTFTKMMVEQGLRRGFEKKIGHARATIFKGIQPKPHPVKANQSNRLTPIVMFRN